MPRSKQLITALAAFWILYACAAVYEWSVDGQLDPAAALAASTGATSPAGTEVAPGAMAIPARVLTAGDLVVLMALAFIVAALSATVILARREMRGPYRQPGMGAFDDPLWSGGEVDLQAPWARGQAGPKSLPR
jgi:hypothetical protein